MKCEYCDIKMTTHYGSGRFCNVKCARGFSTSRNREETSKKISQANKKPHHQFNCMGCGLLVVGRRKKTRYCGIRCSSKDEVLNEKRFAAVSSTLKNKFANDLEARHRMREIGRKGGFGTRCETVSGIKCDSIFERKSFEILERYGILFIPHQILPESSRISDAYIPSLDIWVEFDGINREKRYTNKTSSRWLQWEGKLQEYARKQLDMRVFVSHSQVEDFCKQI